MNMSNISAQARRRHESGEQHHNRQVITASSSFDDEPRPSSPGRMRSRTSSSEDTSKSYNVLEDSEKNASGLKRFLLRQLHLWQYRVPLLRKVVNGLNRIPKRVRFYFLILWLIWKFTITALFLRLLLVQSTHVWAWRDLGSGLGVSGHSAAGVMVENNNDPTAAAGPLRILYIVTALAEYNTGSRSTTKGQDRLGEVLLPVLVDGVESMISDPFGYHVDVYLILGYTLRPERKQMVLDRLPEGVGLSVWDDAIPFGYDKRHGGDKMIENTRSLARQHRYVIKDKLHEYDLFMAFEDDMRITGAHVEHFISMSAELDRLRQLAPTRLPDVPENQEDPTKMKFFGNMTQGQMQHLMPGFVRVEVLLNETENGAQKDLDPIPLDYDFAIDGTTEERHIDPSVCCHHNMSPKVKAPQRPPPQDVIIWETNVKGLHIRQIPGSSSFDWVVLMPGPGKRLSEDEWIGGYWSGRDGAFGTMERPSGGQPDIVAQQGGWMATRDQILRLNSGLCQGVFLPPFDPPMYHEDGQQAMNVEFWSGGYQLFTGVRGGCNMQRLMSFHPDQFSKHLIYHVANNKQRQLPRKRMLRADHLFAQLNTVKKAAEKTKEAVMKKA